VLRRLAVGPVPGGTVVESAEQQRPGRDGVQPPRWQPGWHQLLVVAHLFFGTPARHQTPVGHAAQRAVYRVCVPAPGAVVNNLVSSEPLMNLVELDGTGCKRLCADGTAGSTPVGCIVQFWWCWRGTFVIWLRSHANQLPVVQRGLEPVVRPRFRVPLRPWRVKPVIFGFLL